MAACWGSMLMVGLSCVGDFFIGNVCCSCRCCCLACKASYSESAKFDPACSAQILKYQSATHPQPCLQWSKTLALLYLTMGLIYCGGLGIYAVSGASLYDAFWQAVAGVGIDWTFTEEAEQGRGCAEGVALLPVNCISRLSSCVGAPQVTCCLHCGLWRQQGQGALQWLLLCCVGCRVQQMLLTRQPAFRITAAACAA